MKQFKEFLKDSKINIVQSICEDCESPRINLDGRIRQGQVYAK